MDTEQAPDQPTSMLRHKYSTAHGTFSNFSSARQCIPLHLFKFHFITQMDRRLWSQKVSYEQGVKGTVVLLLHKQPEVIRTAEMK